MRCTSGACTGGGVKQRINRVKELGYLFVKERPPAACDRLPN